MVSIRVTKPEGFTSRPDSLSGLGLDIEENGKTEYAARGYSIASVPSDPFLEFFIVEVPQGLVSPRLCALEAALNFGWKPILGLPAAGKTSCFSKSLVSQHRNRLSAVPQHSSPRIRLGKMAYDRSCPFRAFG